MCNGQPGRTGSQGEAVAVHDVHGAGIAETVNVDITNWKDPAFFIGKTMENHHLYNGVNVYITNIWPWLPCP